MWSCTGPYRSGCAVFEAGGLPHCGLCCCTLLEQERREAGSTETCRCGTQRAQVPWENKEDRKVVPSRLLTMPFQLWVQEALEGPQVQAKL